MSANKCCCCRFLSSFACFSDKKTAKPISSETALSSLNVIANASSAAALTVEEPHVTSAIPPSNAASGDILGHDSQPSSPSTAASSQASASKDVLVMQNDPQPIAPSAVPSSSQPTLTSFASPTSSQTIVSPLAHPAHDKGFQVGSSSNPSPSSVLTVESSRAISSSAIAAFTPNASHDILGHDSQPSSPSAASSSQANASKDENNSQSIAPSAVPSSSQPTVTSVASPTSSHTIASPPAHPAHDKRIQVVSSSAPSSSRVLTHSDHITNIREASQPTVTSVGSPTPSHTIASPPAHPAHDKRTQVVSSSAPSSSRVLKHSDHITNIREADDAVYNYLIVHINHILAFIKVASPLHADDNENVNANLIVLVDYILELLDFIKNTHKEKTEKKPLKAMAVKDLSRSKELKNLREMLSEGYNVVKDVCPDVKTIAQGLLKGMGAAHIFSTGLLVVANILERQEAISTNKEAHLSILGEMNILTRHVKKLLERPKLKEKMDVSIREAIVLIVEASVACCTQMDASKISRFFSTTVDGEELAKFKTRLTETNTHMQREISLCTVDAIEHLRKPRDIAYPQYPEYAVGIETPLQEVIELLERGSDKNAVAIVLHGFGGLGKSTLADAVFARQFDENIAGCKYSVIKLFENIDSTPNITQLQTRILRDLMGEEPKEIRRYEDGQLQIEDMLEKQEAFIYIDNVLLQDDVKQRGDALEQLLPKNMGHAKKLRLLITARNKDATRITEYKGVKTECYAIESLPEEEAVKLFKKKLDDNKKQLNSSQVDQIVKICGGVPKLLMVVGGFICKGNPQKEYRTLMAEARRKNWNGKIGNSIELYVFAYDKLDKNLKDPFLDICTFFRGWNWVELSNIVGESELEKLEERALVTQDVKSKTARVHDVILEIGLDKKGERFRFTSASEIQDFLDEKKDEDLKEIKGICSSDNMDPIYIPSSKLDLMHGSLRVLILGNSTEVIGKCKEIFKKLVIFHAGVSRFPFDASKLKKFEMLSHIYCKLEDLENLSQMPFNLRHIEFELKSHPFHISSNCIQQLSKLQVLRLKNARLKILPQEFGDLVNGLQELTLSNCKYLEYLPGSVSRLESFIRVLRVKSCSFLKQLPEDFGSLNSLQELDLSGCKSLKELPSSLENLTSLQKLDLSYCESLKKLPRNLGNLTLLQELRLFHCISLEHLPSSLEELSSLRLLILSYCNIIELPDGLGKLTSLVNLHLNQCGKLSSIPDSIGQLKLHSIDFSFTDLKELPDGFCNLSVLTELEMFSCKRLEKLPDRFGEVTSLRKIRLNFCDGLKELPQSFNQLKSLEHLDLSSSVNLEELCIKFKGLSSLRVLSLENCNMLKKLPEDFDCVTSLKVLDLRNCRKLEGKWMDSMVKMKTLQIVRIGGSTLLEEAWGEIRGQCDQSLFCAVYTAQGLSNEANILKQLPSKFDSMITNGQGKPFDISGLPVNTLLLVIFDGEKEFSDDFPSSLFEENIDDIQTNVEIVYFGNHFDQLPRKVVNRILGHAPANREAKALFQKVFSLVAAHTDSDWLLDCCFQMSAKIVSDEEGNKYLSSWQFVEVEEFVVKKCGRYLKLKQLIERPTESNIELLKKLFAGGDEEISLGFLKNDASTKVGVDELKGKTILLDIRPAYMCSDIPLQSLVDMYVAKERLDFEIITIPITQEKTNMDVSHKFSKEVPWLVLQNPWTNATAASYFLVEGCPTEPPGWDSWYPNKMRIIESNGTIAAHNSHSVMRMVNTWGAEAYPFTAEKWRELIEKEKKQMEDMSDLVFLFKHLESVSEQVKKATRQQKMICLYSCRDGEFTNSIKDVLIELSNIIYIIYIPNFSLSEKGIIAEFTGGIRQWFLTLEPSKMSQGELQRMFFLSLSEHEAMRFWARIYSLNEEMFKEINQFRLFEMLSKMLPEKSFYDRKYAVPYSWMFIMDEDGNVITTEVKDIVKLFCKEYPDERAKELMQELIKGAQESWNKTLLEF